jgi:hemoglobin
MSAPELTASGKPRVGPGVPVGVDEPMIRELVHTFYGRVRQDPEIGPIFNREVDDWDEHLAKLCDFWSSVLLMSGRFKGQPMAVHVKVGDIEPRHFLRWLALFEATARELWPQAAAEVVIDRARQIGRSLELGISVSRGELPPVQPRRT